MDNLPPDFLSEVEKYCGKVLNRKDDLLIIIEAYRNNNKFSDFEKLSFTGKYVNGLLRVLKSSVNIPEVESVDHIKRDLSENMENIVSQLTEVTSNINEKDKNYIEDNYLKLSHISLQNLQQLAEDLDKIKKYLNHIKRDDSNKTS